MQYQLRVIKQGQAPFALRLEAMSDADAKAEAERQGFTVLHTKSIGSGLNPQQNKFPILLFCQEFRVLLEAGLPVVEVLETLIQKEANPVNQSRLQHVLTAIQHGQTLSQAMAAQGGIFPSLLVASVRAAETTGNLPEALVRYSQYGENVDLLKKRIASASVYPAIVISFGVLVLGFLLLVVIPKFAGIYETQVQHVSTSTQWVLSLTKFSKSYGTWIAGLIIAVLALLMWVFKQPLTRARISRWAWSWPYIGEKIRLYHLSRFYRTLGMLLKSGLTVSASLGQVNQMMGGELDGQLRLAQQLISEGKSFSEAFQTSHLVTPVAMRLFQVGEKTGTLEQMMERAAAFHEDEMLRWVDKFTKVLEPALMAVIGFLIGGIVLMLYMPIFELASGIQ